MIKLTITYKILKKGYGCSFVKNIPPFRKMCTVLDDVIIESIGTKGVITLNRPKALNALNLSMVKKILPTLQQWEREKDIVIVKGTGEKSFCAGGDVRAIVEAGLKGEKLGQKFFKWEYTMNGLIGSFKQPYVALIDGITMGGGVGLSVHGRYRVATERTLFAMPETAIGLFPDVGGSYFLPKLQNKLGLFLALTGHRLKGSDVQKAGIATHYVNSKQISALEKDILSCSNDAEVKEVLNQYNETDGKEFSLCNNLDQINECFSARTVEEIVERLQEDGSDWARSTLNILNKMSPTSMKVSKKLLDTTEAQNLSLEQCLTLEYRVAVNTLNNTEFYEGVRALLIDKDQNPKWTPKTLKEVGQDIVDRHFNHLPPDEELKWTKPSRL